MSNESVRILSLGNYPILNPRHGGQLRVRALMDRLSAAGWQVKYFCVFDANAYTDVKSDLWNRAFTQKALNDLGRRQHRYDFFATDALFTDPELNAIIAGMTLFDPQIIMLEHPWLWPLAERLLEILPSAKIVYSSQNVELNLAEDAVRLATPVVRRETLTRVRQLEQDLLQRADLTIAVSQADADYFQKYARKVVVFRNGISRPWAPGGLEYWTQRLGATRFALFVGSAHPPNASGLARMLGPSLGFLSPVERVVVLGGVSNILDHVEEYTRNKSMMACRLELVGVQDEGGLATMLHLSRCIILPIVEGGGSNLKTAEALLSGKAIVGTPTSFRGFEEFIDLPRVQICDDPASFQMAMTRVLRDDRFLERRADTADVSTVLWTKILEDLPAALKSLLAVARFGREALRLDCKNGFGGVLKYGWHLPDNWGAWSTELEASIELPVQPHTEFQVVLCLAAPTGPREVNRIRGWIGTQRLFELDFGPNYEEREATFMVKPTMALKTGTVLLRLGASFLVRPQEHGLVDGRSLGVGVRYLDISSGPSRP